MSVNELRQRLAAGNSLQIIDVREPIEFHTHNIGGINIPLAQLPQQADVLNWNKASEIIVLCQAGIRSKTAQSILNEKGYTHVRNLQGGLLALRRLNNKSN